MLSEQIETMSHSPGFCSSESLKIALICWHSTAMGLPLTGIKPASSSSFCPSQPPQGLSLQLDNFSKQQNEMNTFLDFILPASREGRDYCLPCFINKESGTREKPFAQGHTAILQPKWHLNLAFHNLIPICKTKEDLRVSMQNFRQQRFSIAQNQEVVKI